MGKGECHLKHQLRASFVTNADNIAYGDKPTMRATKQAFRTVIVRRTYFLATRDPRDGHGALAASRGVRNRASKISAEVRRY